MLSESQRKIPRTIRSAINKLRIPEVAGGYMTKVGSLVHAEAEAFTCWNKEGRPICVLYRAVGEKQWSQVQPLTPLGEKLHKAGKA